MRILWVKMGGLWPANTGGRVRSLQILSELSSRHRVSVVTTHGSSDDPEGLVRQLPQCRQIRSIPYVVPKRGDRRFPLAVARSWLSADPVDLRKWRVPQVRAHVDTVIALGAADVIVADFLFAAVNVPFGGPAPVVLFEHNVEYQIWKRLCAIERSPLQRALLEVEWRKVMAREADVCTAADLTIAVSDDDRMRLRELAPGARVTSIPTGVDTSYFHKNGTTEVPGRIVFTGSMDWHPNEDAVLYFIDTILPSIRREIPGVSFAIVGRNPTERLRAAAAGVGALVSGTVDDVRPWMEEGAVCVVPLRAGGGTRLKIFEALAMEKAVVSTTVGAEGLALTPGREFVAADDPSGFAQAVIALLRDPSRRRALGRAGRRLVEERYSWGHVAREFEERCEGVLEARARSQSFSAVA
jgi:polysaccharide biosynthesis protein PslH